MKKSWGLLPKVLTREKGIESRWLKNKSKPWGKVSGGDRIYFKNSGEPIIAMATVSKVLEIENLTPNKVKQILYKYGKQDGIDKKDVSKYYSLFKDKKYCILVFLRNAKVVKPFNINKKGFGAMSAWITLENMGKIRVKRA